MEIKVKNYVFSITLFTESVARIFLYENNAYYDYFQYDFRIRNFPVKPKRKIDVNILKMMKKVMISMHGL